jgi:D-alanyl-D-alanine carboxypeptidase
MTLRVLLLTLLTSLAALAGCGGEEPEESAARPPVERRAQDIARSGARSVIVFVSDGGKEHVATAGTDRPTAAQRFRVGSVTKTFTATIVLQLIEEEALGLGDALADHLPGVVPKGDEITIRQLLGHRSGLANITDYPAWLERASRSSSTQPIDTLRFAARQPLVFPPGSDWGYSNTNYIALGLVIEKVTGHSYAQELEERILQPLELDKTELPTTRRVTDLDDDGENPKVPWAAGAIVSNAQDLARFYSALLSGQLLSGESLAAMKQTVVAAAGAPVDGLGLFSIDTRCGRFWGHDGGILDYATLVSAGEDGDRVAVISVHGGTPTGPPPDLSELLCDVDSRE